MLELLSDNSEASTIRQPNQVALLIKANIANILSVREGSVAIRPDMGLPDFRNMGPLTTAQLAKVSQGILYQISSFEPRLDEVNVMCQPVRLGKALYEIIISGKIKDMDMSPLTMTLQCMNNGKIVML